MNINRCEKIGELLEVHAVLQFDRYLLTEQAA